MENWRSALARAATACGPIAREEEEGRASALRARTLGETRRLTAEHSEAPLLLDFDVGHDLQPLKGVALYPGSTLHILQRPSYRGHILQKQEQEQREEDVASAVSSGSAMLGEVEKSAAVAMVGVVCSVPPVSRYCLCIVAS